jgi:hypothetical protein
MKYSIILAVLLAGCSTVVPVKQKFPEVPGELAITCPTLKELPADTNKLSDVVTNVTENYSTYYECQAKQEAWGIWYKEQRRIYEEVK